MRMGKNLAYLFNVKKGVEQELTGINRRKKKDNEDREIYQKILILALKENFLRERLGERGFLGLKRQ